MKGLISKESPVGQALLGHKVGDRVFIQIGQSGGYWAQVRAIEKGVDDDSMEISKY
jgi:transcription elongation factor GreA